MGKQLSMSALCQWISIWQIGPQRTFPFPERIFNYNCINYVALTLSALDESSARIDGLEPGVFRPIFSGYRRPESAPQAAWEERLGAY